MHALLSLALGAGSIVFGLAGLVAPAWFARLFGIAAADNPTMATVVRSVSIRDVAIGAGLIGAVRSGDPDVVDQWLRARAACDSGDAVAVGIAVAAGARDPRFVGLGLIAVAAAGFGGLLVRFRPRRRARW